MILQRFSDQQFQVQTQLAGGDWRTALGVLVLQWCATQDQERGILTLQKWGFLSFMVRVKHLRAIVEYICGPLPQQSVLP